LEEFINFDEKILTNIKKRNKKIFKIRNSLNLNNVNFNNNKKTSGSRASRDLGKGANIIKNRFKCFYTNATSLSNKLASLETLFAMEDPDAVFVSETWYNENSCPGFENYTLHRKDRVGQRMGGGVCIYIKKSIDYYSYSLNESDFGFTDSSIETVWCCCLVNNEKLLLGCIYRPGDASEIANEEINNVFIKANELVKKGEFSGLLITGDFNYGDIVWDESKQGSLSSNCRKNNKFLESVEESGVYQNVNCKTFQLDDGILTNTLDLIFTDSQNRIDVVESQPPLGLNLKKAHLVLSWDFNLKTFSGVNLEYKKSKFMYKKGDYKKLSEFLNTQDWENMFRDKDVQYSYSEFLRIYNESCERFIPKIDISGNFKTRPKWLTSGIKSNMRKRLNLWHAKKRANGSDSNLVKEYEKIKKVCENGVNGAVRDYEKNIAKNAKNNPKMVYSYMNSKKSVSDNIRALNDETGKRVEDPGEIVKILNNQFKSVFEKDNGDIPDVSSIREQVNEKNRVCGEYEWGDLTNIKCEIILEKIKKLNEFKAFGVDKVSNAVLKNCAEAFIKPLKLIFDISLKTGEVPREWKEANVTPLFKKGCKLERSNYRPVSLTSTICKILESIIRDKVMKYMQLKRLIDPGQHGFVPNKACVTNLLETLDIITDAVKNGKSVDLVLLDFAKAFDKVSHAKLIQKLEAYGVNSILVKWIKSFLTGRKQRVVIGDNISEWEDVTSSVPQGSVLGPLLFTIFINDLPERIKNECRLYADDSKLIGVIEKEEDAIDIQKDIDSMQSWAKTWQMSFNYDKCKVMHFGKKNREQTYTMSLGQDEQPHVIEKSLVERDLGLMLSHDLKWVTQVEKATKAAKAIIAQIRNSFRYFDAELVRLLYVSLVRPHLEFAVPVWNPYLRKDIEKLENIQHRATRLAPRLRKRGYEYRLEQLRLTTLETRRKRGDLIQFYKVLNGHDHIKWKSEPEKILQGNNDGPASRNLRRGGIIFRREPATMCTPRNEFFLNRVFPLWNNLPQIIREAKSLNCFKAGLDRMELFKI
jgi:hypothetical protein